MGNGRAHQALRTDQSTRGARVEVRASRDRLKRDITLRFGQRAIAFGVEINGGAAIAPDHHPGNIAEAAGRAASGRSSGLDLDGGRAKTLAQDDVHDALIGAVAIFERDLLGQDFDPLDGFGGDVAQFAKTRDALAVQKQDGLFAATPARATDLRRERSQKLGDTGRTGGADVAAGQRILRRNVAEDRAAWARADDDDILLVGGVFGVRWNRRRGGRGLGRDGWRWSVLRVRRSGQRH